MRHLQIRAAIFAIIFLVSTLNYALAAPEPTASSGILDLAGWDFEKDGSIGLDGQWEFYWEQLYQPSDFRSDRLPKLTGYINAPGYWDGYRIGEQTLTGTGYATFRLRIKNLPTGEQLAFQIPLMHTAYLLWANGRLLSSNGTVGTSHLTSKPQYLPRNPVLNESPSELELVLQISNFSHNNGGIWQTLKMGLQEDVVHAAQIMTAFDLFLLGAIFIMALYHFAIYALRRKEASPLFFGVFCLVVSFRISIHGATIFSVLFPDIPWELLVKLDYFTLYFGLSYYCAFIFSLYRLEFSRKVLNLIFISSVGFVIFTMGVPAKVFTAYLTYYQAIMGASCLYTLYVLIRAIMHKREGAKVVLGGCAIIILTLVNDILYNHEIIHTGDWVGFGLFFMIFSQSYVLSSKFSKAFDLVEELSIHLDQMVKERTAAIKDLLDNTGQGFFSFARDYRVQQFTSKATLDFFGKPIEQENALELLFPDTVEDTKKLLNLVFEDANNLDLIEGILPSEVKKNDRMYSVDYHWIEARDSIAGRLMIVMTDITTQRKLEEQLKVDEEKNQMIVKIAVDRHGFIDFLNDVYRCLDQVDQILAKQPSAIEINELFRLFHTIKGGMASYFFLAVSERAHAIESLLASARTEVNFPSKALLESVKKEAVQLREVLKATLSDLEQIVPKQLIDAGYQPYFRIAESKLTELESVLKAELDRNRELKRVVSNLRKQPIRNLMKKYAADAEVLADSLGKKLKISLQGDDTELIHKPFKHVFAALIHIIRNCVDHGIEHPDERLAANKPEFGMIEIKVDVDNAFLRITIADDGAGIDANMVKAKALEKRLIEPDQAKSMSDSAAIKLIFLPGFSTKDDVTQLSGRGVGMDAVAEAVSALKGKIDIRTTPGVGSRFMITIPNN